VPTIFTIPEDLGVFTDAALVQMSDTAVTEYNSLFASMQADPGLQTEENLARLDALKKFTQDADNTVSSRHASAGRMANHSALAAKTDAEDTEDATDNSADEGSEGEADGEEKEPVKGKSNYATDTPRVGDVARNAPKPDNDRPGAKDVEVFGKFYAAGNVEGFSAGQ